MVALSLVLSQIQTVTFSAPATPLKFLLPEISQKVGVQLRADRAMESTTLVVRVKDIPPKDFIQAIATASFGVWRKESDGGQILEVNQPLIDKRWDNKKRAEKSALVELLKPNPKDSPQRRVLRNLLTLIGADQLSKIEETDRVVYSSRPTKMQRPLNISSSSTQELVAARNAYTKKRIESMRTMPVMEIPTEMMEVLSPESIALIRKSRETFGPKLITQTAAKSNLAVTWNGFSLSSSMLVYDAKGDLMLTASETFNPPEEPNGPEDDKPKKAAKPLAFSQQTKFLVQALRAEVALSEDQIKTLRNMVTDPVRSDPILTYLSELIPMFAPEGNLVANVDSETFSCVQFQPDGEVALDQTWLDEVVAVSLDKLSESQVTIYRPKDIYFPNDRAAFARLFTLSGLKELTFEQWAEWAYLRTQRDVFGMHYGLVSAFQQTEADCNCESDLLSIYWLLSDAQKTALKAGQTIPYASLNDEIKDIIYAAAFEGYRSSFEHTEDQRSADKYSYEWLQDPNEMIKELFADEPKTVPAIYDEPTEAMPEGFPKGGFFFWTIKPLESFAILDQKGEEIDEVQGQSSVAEWLADQAARPPRFAKQVKGIRLKNQRVYNFGLLAGPNYSYEASHPELVGQLGPLQTIASLGPEFGKQVATLTAKAKKFNSLFDGEYYSDRVGKPPPQASRRR
ncbi:MAG: hypothetical protein ABL949_12115 [Fimbriimonadaceae bacterium]